MGTLRPGLCVSEVPEDIRVSWLDNRSVTLDLVDYFIQNAVGWLVEFPLAGLNRIEFVEFSQEAGKVFSPEPAVTAAGNTVRLYYALVTPPSHGINVYAKKLSYFLYGQHCSHIVFVCHTLPLLRHHYTVYDTRRRVNKR